MVVLVLKGFYLNGDYLLYIYYFEKFLREFYNSNIGVIIFLRLKDGLYFIYLFIYKFFLLLGYIIFEGMKNIFFILVFRV